MTNSLHLLAMKHDAFDCYAATLPRGGGVGHPREVL
jgi:hypothetical protein